MKILRPRMQKKNLGIALFILMTAIALMSLVMRELIMASSTQATRVRNSADRIQALYLARSSLNLARFILAVDRIIDSQKSKSGTPASDRLDDIWATPNYFPLKSEEIELILQAGKDRKSAAEEDPKKHKEFTKKCETFFDDFPGDAVSLTTDLGGRIVLNDLADVSATPTNRTFDVLVELLRPNVEFLRHLNDRNIQPENLAREIRDYMDSNDIEDENKVPETNTYSSLRLDYEPKNRMFTTMDELKLIPHMDDTIYDYLSELVSPYNIPNSLRSVPSKINLNTVGKTVFQSLLKNVSDAETQAEKFIKDRKENKRTYTDKDIGKQLTDAMQLTNEMIRLNLLTGVSDSFKIETTATVNRIEVKLETIVARAATNKKMDPIISMRISP